MIYKDILKGIFRERPNRFIAHVEINNKIEVCHVKNTGRCKELLIDGVEVYLQHFNSQNRKTKYDLIAVKKGDEIINIDSQAPNKVFYEWILKSNFFENVKLIKPEKKYGNSRFDFFIETEKDNIFVEVKGVTLEQNGVALFPDAPTERGVKHIYELLEAKKHGYQSYIFFVIQMKNIKCFKPNNITHPEFADALKTAYETGVVVKCVDCVVKEDQIYIDKFIEYTN